MARKLLQLAFGWTGRIVLVLVLVFVGGSFFLDYETIGGTIIGKYAINAPDLTDGLIRHYTFDGPTVSSSTYFTDLSGNNYGMEYTYQFGGTLDFSTTLGVLGQAVLFDGTDDVATSSGTGMPSGDFTIATWIRPDAGSPGATIFFASANGGGYDEGEIALAISNDNTMNVNLNAGGGSDVTTVQTAPDEVWTHVVLRRSDNLIQFYFNGVVDANTGTDGATLSYGCDNVYGGELIANDCNWDSLVADFQGAMDDFRMYNQAISTSTIESIYALGARTKINTSLNNNDSLNNGLVGYWTFDGDDLSSTSTVNAVYDRSGNGNHGYYGPTGTPAVLNIPHATAFSETNDTNAGTINVWEDVENTDITHTELTNAGFSDTEEVLIIADFSLEGSDANQVFGARIADTAGTLVDGTHTRYEPRTNNDRNEHFRVMTRTTKTSGEGFVAQKAFFTAATAAHVHRTSLTVIGLDGLTENADYVYDDDSAAADLTGATSTHASVSTPVSSDWAGDVLVLESHILDPAAGGLTDLALTSLTQDSTTDVNYTIVEAEDSGELKAFGSNYVFNHPDSSSHTYAVTMKNSDSSTDSWDHAYSSVIAFPASLFHDFQYAQDSTKIDHSVSDTYEELDGIASFSPASTSDYLLLGHAVGDFQAATVDSVQVRIQVGGSNVPSGFVDTDGGAVSEDALERRSATMHTIESFNTSAKDVDLDGVAESTGHDWLDRTIVAVAMHATTSGGSAEDPTPRPGKVGGSLEFDSSEFNFIEVPDSSDFTGTTFSVAGWLYVKQINAGDQQGIISQNHQSASPDDERKWGLRVETSGVLSLEVFDTDCDIVGREFANTPSAVETGKWVHFLAEVQPDEATLYIDNASSTSVGLTSVCSDVNAALRMGAKQATTDQADESDVRLDDVRYYNRTLSAAERTRLYEMGATTRIGVTPTPRDDFSTLTTDMVGYWSFDGKDIDLGASNAEVRASSTSNLHGEIDANTGAIDSVPGKFGQALRFDDLSGDHDGVYILSGADTGLLTSVSAAAISAWVRISDDPTSVSQIIFDVNGDTGGSRFELQFAESGGDKFGIGGRSQSGDSFQIVYAPPHQAIERERWYHVVGMIDYANDDLFLYLDGKLANSSTSASFGQTTTASGEPTDVRIGANSTEPGTNHMDGIVDEIRLYERLLTQEEIEYLYELGQEQVSQ